MTDFTAPAVIVTLLLATTAQAQDLHSMAPPQILQLDTIPGAGKLFLKFCLLGNHVCVERTTSCHGGCCRQSMADSEGYGCSGDVYGIIPPGSHYAGWRCEVYDTGQSVDGPAGPAPKDIDQCHNFR